MARRRSLDRIGMLPSTIPPGRLDEFAPLHPQATALLRTQLEEGHLTGRGYHRVRRVARTIAELDGASELVTAEHVAVALNLRVRLRVSMREFVA